MTKDERKAGAARWFEALRDDICAAFEAIEDAYTGSGHGPGADAPPGRFERKPWERRGDSPSDGGGGVNGPQQSLLLLQARGLIIV